MHRPSRWWLGLPALAILLLAALWLRLAPVQIDVARNASAALAAQSALDPTVSVAGRDVRIAGLAPDETGRAGARAAVEAATGVRLVEGDLAALPTQKPYTLTFARGADGLVATGYAPNPALRAATLKAAGETLGAAIKLRDERAYAAGAPADYEAAARAALAALAPLKSGTASVSDGALSIVGEAADADAYAKALEATKSLPAGLTLARFDVAPPKVSPYVFSARRDGPGVTLSGFAPDMGVRERLFETARGSAPQALGALGLASGAPVGFEAMAKAALAALAQLKSGVATISDATLSLSGEAASANARDSLLAMLRAAGLTLDKIDIAIPAAPAAAPTPPVAAATPRRPLTEAEAACEGRLLQRLAQEHIEFDTGSSRIVAASQPLVRELADVVSSCPAVTLEVQGYTDNVGEPDANLALSRARAQAVVKALVAAGAPADHLTAEGYGETRPIAANDTPEGRAQNRRIEFAVK